MPDQGSKGHGAARVQVWGATEHETAVKCISSHTDLSIDTERVVIGQHGVARAGDVAGSQS
jgi:hypothetical protein